MLDEKAKRLPGINPEESVPVVFGDNQEWFVPRPTFDVFASFSSGLPSRRVECSFGPDYEAKLKALTGASGENTTEDEWFSALAVVACDLLRRNYDLSDSDFASILRYRVGDTSGEWIKDVIAVANGGMPPKPSAGGSA